MELILSNEILLETIQEFDRLHLLDGCINKVEKEVIFKKCGYDDEPMSLNEIADLMGIEKEKVRMIERRAIKKLQKLHESNIYIYPEEFEE